jgi:hypothetical protein
METKKLHVTRTKVAILALALALGSIVDSFGETLTIATPQTAEACGGLAQAASFSSRTMKSMAVIGDSISRAFNSVNGNFFIGGTCAFAETLSNSWATSDNTTARCKADAVYSLKERLECANRRDLASINVAKSGASMARDVYAQAVAAKRWLITQPAPRHVAILMGHNDICQGTQVKNTTCNKDPQKSPNNYCRTSEFAFEKEFRRALDVLVQIRDSRIGVAIPVRVSQACSLKGKNVPCYFLFDCSCQDVWNFARLELFDVFKGPGVCRSITANGCSNARVIDAYRTWKRYKDILIRVTKEYDTAPGARIPANTTFGTGKVTKAAGVDLDYSEAIANYKLQSGDISQCDCYHPNKTAQNRLAAFLYSGLTCTKATPCCRDTGNELNDGLCRYTWTDGRKIKGFW